MLGVILGLLVLFYFLGYISIPGLVLPNLALFTINGQNITLWNLLILLLVTSLLGLLPSPLREIAGVVLILWILSTLGILAIAGLSSILVIAIIVGLALYLLSAVF